MSGEGVNRLARVIQSRVYEVGAKAPALDFGGIQSDMSLVADNFPVPIPQTDYIVCRSVTWGAVNSAFSRTQSGGCADCQHTHETLVGESFRWLRPGDRVLVAWVGDDACVIDLIVPASAIG